MFNVIVEMVTAIVNASAKDFYFRDFRFYFLDFDFYFRDYGYDLYYVEVMVNAILMVIVICARQEIEIFVAIEICGALENVNDFLKVFANMSVYFFFAA